MQVPHVSFALKSSNGMPVCLPLAFFEFCFFKCKAVTWPNHSQDANSLPAQISDKAISFLLRGVGWCLVRLQTDNDSS